MFDFLFSWLQGPTTSKRTNQARQSFTSFLGFPSTPNYADADGPPTERPNTSALPPAADAEANTDTGETTDNEASADDTTTNTDPEDS